MAAWGKFLAAGSDEDLETLAKEDPVFKQAKDALDRLSADDEARIRAEQREMALFSYELDITTAGRQGEARGELKGKAVVLLEQLTLKFGELPGSTRERVEKATDVELMEWLRRVLSAGALDEVFGG